MSTVRVLVHSAHFAYGYRQFSSRKALSIQTVSCHVFMFKVARGKSAARQVPLRLAFRDQCHCVNVGDKLKAMLSIEIRESSGRGQGIFSRRDFSQDDIVLCETPSLRAGVPAVPPAAGRGGRVAGRSKRRGGRRTGRTRGPRPPRRGAYRTRRAWSNSPKPPPT